MPQNFQRQLLLFDWLPRASVANCLKTQCIGEEAAREPEILQQWDAASKAFNSKTARLFETIAISAVEEKYAAKLKTIREDSRFSHTYTQLPTDFGVVEIDKLIACQATVALDYVDKLAASFPQNFEFQFFNRYMSFAG